LKDFFLHLLTITVGLLIALGLENAAEAVHHRHQREEAEQTIRQELQENHEQIEHAQKAVQDEVKAMLAVLAYMEARQSGKPGDPNGLTLSFSEQPLQDSAWSTAAATGVLTYMKYADVQKFALCYKEQALFEAIQQQALDEYLQLDSYVVRGFDPTKIDPDDIKTALPVVRRALAHLIGMLDISRAALTVYDKALQ
jgi:uncharacterized glyoxalase superfamily protein PhnB